MAKKWSEFTRREKTIGVLVAIFAVISLGGISNAITGGSTVTPTPSTQTSTPLTTYKEVEETEVIPYSKESIEDSSKNPGTTTITTTGVNGEKTKKYKVTLVDGVETTRELIDEEITTPPITEITSIGTYVAPVRQSTGGCDPNYSGACVPIASDVDCSGGSGDGPAYVSGPVYVIGSDIYGLDGRDNDGIGCE
jgi:resuscitation-promoting factor RpfB